MAFQGRASEIKIRPLRSSQWRCLRGHPHPEINSQRVWGMGNTAAASSESTVCHKTGNQNDPGVEYHSS
jgi:hypothetical protein